LDRARAVRPDLALSDENAAAVAQLCGRLEGLPLAIELAAARTAVASPAQILEQIRERFDFLASRHRDRPERHRTLRAAFDCSYRLLAPELRCFFARLSVFAGGWTHEAAAAICEEPRALDFLEELRECSLVIAEEAPRPPGAGSAPPEICFRMLE